MMFLNQPIIVSVLDNARTVTLENLKKELIIEKSFKIIVLYIILHHARVSFVKNCSWSS